MQRIHLLRVNAQEEVFSTLAAELRRRGERLGWLDWQPDVDLPLPLADAANLGVLRAVSVQRGAAVAVKPLTGPPVLRDVAREYFRGCLAVLVRSDRVLGHANGEELPTLVPEPGDGTESPQRFALQLGNDKRLLAVTELCDRLRRPRLFG